MRRGVAEHCLLQRFGYVFLLCRFRSSLLDEGGSGSESNAEPNPVAEPVSNLGLRVTGTR
jgi:hypothetical protein